MDLSDTSLPVNRPPMYFTQGYTGWKTRGGNVSKRRFQACVRRTNHTSRMACATQHRYTDTEGGGHHDACWFRGLFAAATYTTLGIAAFLEQWLSGSPTTTRNLLLHSTRASAVLLLHRREIDRWAGVVDR
jgi:hypothetical protein